MKNAALARAIVDRFNTEGNYEVPEPINGQIRIVNHDNPRKNIVLNDQDDLRRFYQTWDGPGWVVVRVNHLALVANKQTLQAA
ncbi:MAG: hypothetical protein DWQ19_12810 [Crenarchaeota archaeon]|nr:MAG: hypothetical protein DWQ19_12810 [Thermoproteota archaeon]